MGEFSRSEVEAAFRHYFMVGQGTENWEGWAHLFTGDAVYHDHYYGKFTGPGEITRFIEGTMGAAPHVYNPLVWYVIDGNRVVYEVLNRADNPEPGGPPIEFSSWQNIIYAGNGKWRSEEDIWLMGEMKRFVKEYNEALAKFPQTEEQRLSRRDWGDWVDWARPADGHETRPSWMDRENFAPYGSRAELDVGVRNS
ncbi:nuclear transport factor 2 family protein [Tomitella biformata]|uniref:nuclear transport factor 2 family protein n=1 Tax=Tomitella biformata TaxID=630403 RepID=UPI00046313E6|nr:nuclear transport factor 2 family protein [Tomitella biformata]